MEESLRGMNRNYLFVAGCPRSGTTAITRLLNLHPDIVIGLERYKSLYGKMRDILPDMLSEEGFFNFQPGETNFAPSSNREAARFYEVAKEKFPGAKLLGDKYPQFFRFYGKVFERFPEARFVFIVRDPVAVAQSWQRRADDSSSWPQKNDARRSVAYWNDALAYTLAYAQIREGAFVFVEFEELFRSKQKALAELFQRLGVDISDSVLDRVQSEAEAHFACSEEILSRPVELAEEVAEEVRAAADWKMYEEVCRRAREQ